MPACYSSMGTYRLCRAFNPTLSSAYRELALNSLLMNSCSLIKDPMKKKKARNMVRTKFEERYKSGKNRWVKCLMI